MVFNKSTRPPEKENESLIIPVYHGSDKFVKTPLFGYGSADNDYGRGFYLTEDKEQANAWAVLHGSKEAVCNEYELDLNGLNILHLDQYGPLAWMAELVYNRDAYSKEAALLADEFVQKYKIHASNYDVIIGYRAGGNYPDVMKAFLKNEISIEEAKKLFKKQELGQQIFLKSEKAFSQIKYIAHSYVEDKNYAEIERLARIDMSQFLYNRKSDIKEQRFVPQGIFLENTLENKYNYNSVYKYLENECTWKEYEELKQLEEELLQLEQQEITEKTSTIVKNSNTDMEDLQIDEPETSLR